MWVDKEMGRGLIGRGSRTDRFIVIVIYKAITI